MACCLMASSHYLNQCWFTISKVHWHSFEYNFTRDTSAINHFKVSWKITFLKFLWNLPGANELKKFSGINFIWEQFCKKCSWSSSLKCLLKLYIEDYYHTPQQSITHMYHFFLLLFPGLRGSQLSDLFEIYLASRPPATSRAGSAHADPQPPVPPVSAAICTEGNIKRTYIAETYIWETISVFFLWKGICY